jgi:hypothetical protein
MSVSYVPPGTCAIPQSNRVDNLTSTVYVGTAAVGAADSAAVWAIKRMVFSGTVVLTTWADGNPLADNVWDNRASLTYS